MVEQQRRPSLVDPFKAYLTQRIGEGCLSATVLCRESTAQGVPGSYPIVRRFVEQFVDMLTHLRGNGLTAWIEAAQKAALPGITKFATGLTVDLAAVTAGLPLPYSAGAVEGNINRIEMLKRQMHGRATFDLLRKRVLLAT